MTTYTIRTTKGSYTGTAREVIAWQCEHQGAYASIEQDGPNNGGEDVKVDVNHIDFDGDEPRRTTRAVVAAFAAEGWDLLDERGEAIRS